MSALKNMDRKALLKLARSAISDKLAGGSKKEISKDIPKLLKEKNNHIIVAKNVIAATPDSLPGRRETQNVSTSEYIF